MRLPRTSSSLSLLGFQLDACGCCGELGFRKSDGKKFNFLGKLWAKIKKGKVLTFMKTSPPMPLRRALKVDTYNTKLSNERQRAAKSNKVGSSWGLRAGVGAHHVSQEPALTSLYCRNLLLLCLHLLICLYGGGLLRRGRGLGKPASVCA